MTKQKLPESGYDEVFFRGEVRPHYRNMWRAYESAGAAERRRRVKRARAEFHHDAPMLALPRVIAAADYRRIARGAEQRGRALQLFLDDHYFGKRRYARAKLIPAAVLRRIVARSGEVNPRRILRRENLMFMYAPDVIRDPEGTFCVLEDNTGLVGGIGDLEASYRASLALGVRPRDGVGAERFYARLIHFYRGEAKRYGSPKVILLSGSRDTQVDHEDQRLGKICARLGVPTVTDLAELSVSGGQVFHGRDRVGFIFLNRDSGEIEPRHPVTFRRFLRNETAQVGSDRAAAYGALLRRGAHETLYRRLEKYFGPNAAVPGFWRAVRAGRVGVSYGPGMEFTNDKEFYIYVESLVRFYLGEEPILRNLETRSFFRRTDVDEIFGDLSRWVIKGVLGAGGEEVWLGKLLSPREAGKLLRRIKQRPAGFIAQKHVALSTVLNHHVDFRPYVMVSAKKRIVSDTGWGRAVVEKGSGKVNISSGGTLVATSVAKSGKRR